MPSTASLMFSGLLSRPCTPGRLEMKPNLVAMTYLSRWPLTAFPTRTVDMPMVPRPSPQTSSFSPSAMLRMAVRLRGGFSW
jgi:hypothetical protein